ncbi:DNA primase [uncultured Dialister sp.]|uniref:DNA primase n=1 Tax=uncultured Dialister sp. TaxID=278064 RepID=UPI0025882C97|nr:DNA primase [uncultured Dialister sp.]
MAAFNEFIQQLKENINLADLIGSYVPLKKHGRYYMASCPFHGPERTPSFAVSPDKGFYYCFGCHESGDAISFVEKMDHLTFMEAVRRLADYAHMDMPEREESPEEKRRAAMARELQSVTELAGSYFHSCLTRTQMGKAGLAYFDKRHLSMETIEKFKLGFAPPDWQKLYRDFTTKKKIGGDLLVEAGLCANKNGRYYDVFRNRCMFPIWNLSGKIVAFGGRVMDDSKPKYLNSPESPIFNKRRLLFAIYQALPAIKAQKQAIMVEGYMDAISLHAHGVTNAVASLGTAFTIEQARLLKKYADEVVFSYDMDAAGQNATKRALEIAGSVGLKLRVVHLGEGKDPDEFVNLHGGDAYLEAVKQAEPAMDFLFHSLLKQYDSTTLDGQHHILDDMFSVLLSTGDAFQLNAFIKKMARAMHMDEGMIRSEALIYARKNKSNVYISQNMPVEKEELDLNPLKKRQRLLEAGFLNYCLIYHMLPEGYEELNRYQFADEFHGRLFALLEEMKAKNMPLTEEAVEGQLPREDISRLAKLRMEGEQPGSVPREEYIWPMKKIYLQEEYRIHTKKAQELISSDPAKAREEQLLCIQLSKEILALK